MIHYFYQVVTDPVGLSVDKNLKKLVEDFYFGRKIVTAVCHGPAGLLQATDKDGNSILKDKKVTGFTNNEEVAIQLDKVVPFLLEDRMKELGGKFEEGEILNLLLYLMDS
jgi:putative intracellular protease/amidase